METLLQFVKESIQEPEGFRRVLFTILKVGMVFLSAGIVAGWLDWDQLPGMPALFDFEAVYGLVKYAVAAVALLLLSWTVNELVVGALGGVFSSLVFWCVTKRNQRPKNGMSKVRDFFRMLGFLKKGTHRDVPGPRVGHLVSFLEVIRDTPDERGKEIVEKLFSMEVAGLCVLGLILSCLPGGLYVHSTAFWIMLGIALISVFWAGIILFYVTLIFSNLPEIDSLVKRITTWHYLEEAARGFGGNRMSFQHGKHPFLYHIRIQEEEPKERHLLPVIIPSDNVLTSPLDIQRGLDQDLKPGRVVLAISPGPLHERVFEQFKPYEPSIFLRVVETPEDAKRVLEEVIWAVELSIGAGDGAQRALDAGGDEEE